MNHNDIEQLRFDRSIRLAAGLIIMVRIECMHLGRCKNGKTGKINDP